VTASRVGLRTDPTATKSSNSGNRRRLLTQGPKVVRHSSCHPVAVSPQRRLVAIADPMRPKMLVMCALTVFSLMASRREGLEEGAASSGPPQPRQTPPLARMLSPVTQPPRAWSERPPVAHVALRPSAARERSFHLSQVAIRCAYSVRAMSSGAAPKKTRSGGSSASTI
jgi:hypothetical protein